MPKRLELPDDEIARLYLETDHSVYSLAEKYKCSRSVIAKRLRAKLTPEQLAHKKMGEFRLDEDLPKDEIVNLYKTGNFSQEELAKRFNCARLRIMRVVQEVLSRAEIRDIRAHRLSVKIKQAYEDKPAYRERLSEVAKKRMEDPEYRQACIDTLNDPESRAKNIAVIKSPQFRKERSKISKELWADPEFRAKMREFQTSPEFRTKMSKARSGKIHTSGKRVEYAGVKFRSTYEARWARVCDAFGWAWQYQPQPFLYTLPDGSEHRYHPDFWNETTQRFEEVKGYFSPKAQRKIQLIRQQYPDQTLVVITGPLIARLEISVGIRPPYDSRSCFGRPGARGLNTRYIPRSRSNTDSTQDTTQGQG